MTTVTISADGPITIPKAIRERLNFRPGTELTIEVLDQTIFLKRLRVSATSRSPKIMQPIFPTPTTT